MQRALLFYRPLTRPAPQTPLWTRNSGIINPPFPTIHRCWDYNRRPGRALQACVISGWRQVHFLLPAHVEMATWDAVRQCCLSSLQSRVGVSEWAVSSELTVLLVLRF
ncbi:hypothetical protein BaRGS_00033663 [Batillaria attramentaria]|uniref:Uncharacterized protein n=1 Tax=Batillaria attramentaria TaxID=370345 RepID=A0ABD0JKD8_9CAEN